MRSNWALRDLCLEYGIPLLSGKDSMYIDGNLKGPFEERRKVSGLPTLLFTVSSVIPDISKTVTMDVKFPEDLIYILGETRNELGGSEYYQLMNQVGLNVPRVRGREFIKYYRVLFRAIQNDVISSCHAVSRGGLAAHLAMVAMSGELGVEIHLQNVPAEPGLTRTQVLYSESCGRFVLTVAPEKQAMLEKMFDGMPLMHVGRVTNSSNMVIYGHGKKPILEENINALKDSWKKPFGDLV